MSNMSYDRSRQRRERERRLRARYRRKTIATGIIMLLIGLIVGFVLCVISAKHAVPLTKDILKIGPITNATSDSTPAPKPADAQNPALPMLGATEATPAPEDEGDFEDTGAPQGEEPSIVFADPEVQASSAENVGETSDETAGENTISAPEGELVIQAAPEATDAPTEEPTPEPTAEPTPEPTPEVAEPVIVPYGETATLETQIKADGSARTSADDALGDTLNFTVKVDAYKNQAYFQEQYATQYDLQGNEAAVQFDITLNGYTGSTEIVPQDCLLVTLVGEDPAITTQGYQLMDAEINGKPGISVASDVTSTLYKRYSYSAEQGDMKYMAVTTYMDGVQNVYWFDLVAPEPEETPAPEGEAAEGEGTEGDGAEAEESTVLENGSRGDDVVKLQQALIEKGVLNGAADGIFGNMTAAAVSAMQEQFGMEQTGIADQAFLDQLYADS